MLLNLELQLTWNNTGFGNANTPHSRKQSALRIHDFTSMDSSYHGPHSTAVCICWKNSAYKWTHKVQIMLFRGQLYYQYIHEIKASYLKCWRTWVSHLSDLIQESQLALVFYLITYLEADGCKLYVYMSCGWQQTLKPIRVKQWIFWKQRKAPKYIVMNN